MSETTYAPETMLELARACMPPKHPDHEWSVFIPSLGPKRKTGVFGCEYFDPLGNDAHWAAVEKWLFDNARVSKNGNDYYMVDLNKTGWADEEYWPVFNDNLAAAVAVLERMKGEAK